MESNSSLKGDILSAFEHYSSFISCKFVIDAITYCVSGLLKIFLSAGKEKGIKYSQDLSSIMLLFEHNRIQTLVFLRYKATNFRVIGGDCRLPAPTDFIRGILARKLDCFRLDFVSVSDERGSVIKA